MGEVGKFDQYWKMIRYTHPEAIRANEIMAKAHRGAVIQNVVNLGAAGELQGRPCYAFLVEG